MRVTFVPPVVAWPHPDASYDAVILLDELALTVLEEEALAEAARVLRPGGILLLRVPAAGRLAWLDGYNAFRYVQEITHRGPPPGSGGGQVAAVTIAATMCRFLQPHFRVRAMRASGIGLSDCARLALSSSGVGRCTRGVGMRPFVASRGRCRGWKVAWRPPAAATGLSPPPSAAGGG